MTLIKIVSKAFSFFVSYFLLLISYFLLSIFNSSCSSNNVTTDDSLKKYFDQYHVTGTFGLFNNGQGQFTIYNLKRFTDSAYLPASTFKIVNSLIGLQTGVINNEKMVIPWDGVKRSNEAWNKDLTMEEAFRVSAVPYYQEVARRIGKDTMQRWLDTLGYAAKYGRAVIHNDIDSFWLNNDIKITADEQLGLVKRLYFEQLPFQERAQQIVKKVMLQEDNANYRLSYKTGWGFRENGNSIGWIVGWEEENKHPYFFVLQIEGPHDMDMQTVRVAILKNILTQYGFLQGKK
ncbi:MAG TPA: penicillin-binding transpeptidase domain-containing protein [Parafilimonas sp.]|nr:penicillin-binding transpeptidase domain-containing protein [Parafilimonas sp.]